MINREAIYAALFSRLQNIPGFNTTSRRLRHWNDVASSERPALFQAQGHETAKPGDPARGLPTKWTLAVDLYVYVSTTDQAAPGSAINPLLDAIEAALAPEGMATAQTLGGLVEHCWIEGRIDTDEGTLGSQAVAIVPIRLLAS